MFTAWKMLRLRTQTNDGRTPANDEDRATGSCSPQQFQLVYLASGMGILWNIVGRILAPARNGMVEEKTWR